MILDSSDPRHGTINGYSNHGCRCGPCRAANAAEQSRQRAARLKSPPPDHVHGTVNGYNNYGCRCQSCLGAHRESKRSYYRRKLSAAARESTWRKVCQFGHVQVGDNVYHRRDGRRMCKRCIERRKREARAKAAVGS